MPDKTLSTTQAVVGLVIGALSIIGTLGGYLEWRLSSTKADYVERDTAVIQTVATNSGNRNRDLRTIMERTYMDGYDAIIDLIDDRLEVLKDRIIVVAGLSESAVSKRELELLEDEAERLEKVETFVKELKVKADLIWDPK